MKLLRKCPRGKWHWGWTVICRCLGYAPDWGGKCIYNLKTGETYLILTWGLCHG